MKAIRILSALAALFMLMSAFTSCDSKDNDNEPEQPNGGDTEQTVDFSSILGSYSGALGWKVMTVEGTFDEKYEIQISKAADVDDKVTVEIPECSFTMPGSSRPQTIPALTLEDVNVSKTSDGYEISSADFSVKVGETSYDGSDFAGKITGQNIQIAYTMTPGVMPMPINFTFTGTLK